MTDKVLFEIVATAKGVNVVQKQTDKLAQSSDKATKSTDRLSKSRDGYHRREKGAAGISSNSTKNFSKMQQGIDGGGGSGGLVRAYALLAANVFALTAAFGVLSRSAQIDTLTQSMEILSTTGGTYIKSLAKDMQAASGGAIDLAQSFRQVSLASSAGLSTTEIEGLTQVAKGAAISLGRDLPDAMDRIFRGAIKLEPEILDEIGLFVRVDEAAQKYADSVGKSASSLSQAEKRQGFLNEILDQGSRKFQEYADTVKPDPYVRLGAALGDIAQSGISLLNNVLGPVLSFLAESKTALTAVFGVLVISLLGKAIPALGQFNANLATNAALAAKNAKEYTDGLKETTKAQLDKTNAKLRDDKKEIDSQRRLLAGTKAVGPKSDAKGVAALDKQLKKKIGGQKRITLLIKKEQQLKKQINASGEKSSLLLNQDLQRTTDEIALLERKAALTNQIADNNTRGSAQLDGGSLAGMRQEKLEMKSGSMAVISTATGVGETEGLSAGFSRLKKDISETTVKVNGIDKPLNTMTKATTFAKGGVSLLGGAMSRVMMMLGPWMMAFSLLAPLLMGVAKFFGIGSEEAKKFDDSLASLADMQEKINIRMSTQLKQAKDEELSYLERTRAQLAYSKSQAGSLESIIKTRKELAEFNETASRGAKLWEGIKSAWGGDRESKQLVTELDTIRNSIQGAIEGGDEEKLKELGALNQGIRDFIQLSQESISNTARTVAAEEDLGNVSNRRMRQLGTMSNLRAKLTAVEEAGGNTTYLSNILASKGYDKLSDAEKEYVDSAAESTTAKKALAVAGKELNTVQEDSTKGVKEASEAEKIRVLKLTAVLDAQKSMAEAGSKFANSFDIKTKADGMISSFDLITNAMDDFAVKSEDGLTTTNAEMDKFFSNFSNEDNAFKKFFSAEQILEFEKGNTKAFHTTINNLKEYRDNIITAKSELAKFANLQKRANAVQTAGVAANKIEQTQITLTAQKKAQSAKGELFALGLSKNINMEKIELAKQIIKDGGNITEQEKAIAEHGMERGDVQAYIAAERLKETTAAEATLMVDSQITRIKQQEVGVLLKIMETTKAQNALDATRLEQEATLQQLMSRGNSKLDPVKAAALKINAAQTSLKTAQAEADLKVKMIQLETTMLMLRLKVLAEQSGDTTLGTMGTMNDDTGTVSGGTGLFKTLEENGVAAGKLVTDGIANMETAFTISLAKSVEDGFTDGVNDGIANMKNALVKNAEENEGDAQASGESAILMAAFRGTTDTLAEDLKKLGPEGELIASVVQGAMVISEAFSDMGAVFDTTFAKGEGGMEKAAAMAEFAAAAIGQIGQMMAANSKQQVAEIDGQIDAEKKRDGKSKESIAKLAALEKKKEAIKRKAFEQDKKMQMARVVASTAAGIMGVVSGVTSFWEAPMAIATAAMIGAMGAAQLAIIGKTKYNGGGSQVEQPRATALSVGKRNNSVDVSRGSSGGELSYLRGGRGVGSNANDFTASGGMTGKKGYAAGGEGILVGEQGPEIMRPSQKVDIVPNDRLGGGTNVSFSINAVDAAGVEDLLVNQRGNIIRMIREAANDTGERFLETVDTQAYGSNT